MLFPIGFFLIITIFVSIFNLKKHTMNVKITFEPNNLLNEVISLEGEWNFPFLPRIGEEISPALLVEWINPGQLYEALTETEKAMWIAWVTEEVELGSSEEEAQLDNLHIWLANLGNVVSEVCWSKGDKGYCVLITLKTSKD